MGDHSVRPPSLNCNLLRDNALSFAPSAFSGHSLALRAVLSAKAGEAPAVLDVTPPMTDIAIARSVARRTIFHFSLGHIYYLIFGKKQARILPAGDSHRSPRQAFN